MDTAHSVLPEQEWAGEVREVLFSFNAGLRYYQSELFSKSALCNS